MTSSFILFLLNFLTFNYSETKPGSVSQSHLVDLIFEAEDLSEGVQDVDGEAFISLWLPEDVLCHHDERILLQREEEDNSLGTEGKYELYFTVLNKLQETRSGTRGKQRE